MKCEHCNVNDATFLYEENINGNKRSLRLCADCAAKLQAGKLFGDGIEALSIPSFAKMQENFLDGLFGFSPKHPSASTQKACPGCGASWAELLQKGTARRNRAGFCIGGLFLWIGRFDIGSAKKIVYADAIEICQLSGIC